MEVKHSLQLYIQAQGAESTPPLGTVLGNLGVNSVNFCKEFNSFTSDLPNYLTLSVKIIIFSNRSYKFIVSMPSLSSIINLLKTERQVRRKGRTITEQCISLKFVIQLALFKFPKFPLKASLPVLLGMIKSFNIVII